MKTTSMIVAAALTAFAAAAATTASAAIVCNNNDSVCWHTKRAYTYRPEFGVVVHPNNWAWGPTEHFTWREHRGRGYWRNGAWITF